LEWKKVGNICAFVNRREPGMSILSERRKVEDICAFVNRREPGISVLSKRRKAENIRVRYNIFFCAIHGPNFESKNLIFFGNSGLNHV